MNLEWLDDETVFQNALLAELDEQTQALFRQVRALDYGMSLVRFFIEHEHVLSTVEEIAFHLNALLAKVENSVYALEQLGLARQVDVADIALFGVTPDPGRRQMMRDLCAWQERWHSRLARVERAINGSTS
jgi:hypothetical protein